MVYIPEQKKSSRWFSLLFILTGCVIWALTTLDIRYKAVVQLAAVIMIVIGIQLLNRYVLTSFKYVVEDNDDGSSDLIIDKLQGTKTIKVCHVSLGKAEMLYRLSDDADDRKKDHSIARRFNYCRNPGKDAITVLVLRDGDTWSEIRFEPDAAFMEAVRMRMSGVGSLHFMM